MKNFLLVYGKILITTLIILALTTIIATISSENNLVEKTLFLIEKFIILVPVFFMYYQFDKNKWTLGVTQTSSGSNIAKGSLLGFASITASIIISIILVKHTIIFNTVSKEMILSLIYFLLISFCVSFSEEVLFRGYIQGLATHHYNYKVGLVFSTIFFVAMHGLNTGFNLFALLELILGGIFLGVLRERTKGLWYGIGFHFLWDFTQVGVFGLSLSGQSGISLTSIKYLSNNVLVTGGKWGPEASVITSVVLVLLLIFKITKGCKNK